MLSLVAGLVIAIVVAIAQVWYQERSPILSAKCQLGDDGSPAEVSCTVKNTGRAEAREVFVSFTDLLPLGTSVRSNPTDGVSVEESETLVDPRTQPRKAAVTKSFAIKITRVRVGAEVPFTVYTDDADNRRAAKQAILLRKLQDSKFAEFIDVLGTMVPDSATLKRDVAAADRKRGAFFSPSMVSSESGEHPVTFLTPEERGASALFQDLYATHKKSHLDLFKGGGNYRAPVIRIKSPGSSTSTYARFPAYPTTYIEGSFRIPTVEEGAEIEVPIPVPKIYEADSITAEDVASFTSGNVIPESAGVVEIDGDLSDVAWSKALTYHGTDKKNPGREALRGFLMTHDNMLHVGFDFPYDTTDVPPSKDRPWGDFAGVVFDTTGDGMLSTGDEQCTISMQSRRVACQRIEGSEPKGPARTRGAVAAVGFGSTPLSSVSHRTFEMSFPLRSFGLKPGARIAMGFRLYDMALNGGVKIPAVPTLPLPQFQIASK